MIALNDYCTHLVDLATCIQYSVWRQWNEGVIHSYCHHVCPVCDIIEYPSKTLNLQIRQPCLQLNALQSLCANIITSPWIDLAEYVLNKCITQDEKQISIGNFSCSNPTVTPDEPVYYNFDFLVKDNQILDWMVSQESRNWNVCTHVQFKDVFHYAYVYGSPG